MVTDDDGQLRFDLAEGRLKKEQGMELADSARRVQAWKARADACLDALPAGTLFTADGLISEVGLPTDSHSNSNNVVGAWFSGKAKLKRIVFVSMRHSKRVIGHARRISLWKKLQ